MRSSQHVASPIEPRAQSRARGTGRPDSAAQAGRSTIVGLGRSSIYRRVQEGTFPSPIKLGSTRASGWISTEVFEWIEDQVRRCRQ